MKTPVKLGVFGLGLVVVFTAALGLGRAVGSTPAPAATAAHDQHAEPATQPGTAAAAVLPAGLDQPVMAP